MKWRMLAVMAPLLLAGCGSSPPTHFFTLNAVRSSAPQAAAFKGAPIQVRDIQLPPTLDRLEMVLHGPGTQIQVLGTDRWAAPLKGLIRQALTDDLRSRLGDNAVAAPGAPATSRRMQVLILNVQQFSADTAGRVTLETTWSVGRGSPPKAAITKQATIHVNAGSAAPAAVAEGMSRALGELADRIAAAL